MFKHIATQSCNKTFIKVISLNFWFLGFVRSVNEHCQLSSVSFAFIVNTSDSILPIDSMFPIEENVHKE